MNSRTHLQLLLTVILVLCCTFTYAQNVGINILIPKTNLDVVGDTRLQHHSTSSSNTHLELLETGAASSYSRLRFSQINVSDYWLFAARPKSAGISGRFNLFSPDVGNVLTATDAGSIGINVGNPSAMFHVNSHADQDPIRLQYNGSTKFHVFQNGSISMGSSNSGVSSNDVYIHSDLGIGVTVPTARLDVDGTVKSTGFQMTSGAGFGKVLTSNASGKATWTTLSGDNFGNHVAATIINMNNNRIANLSNPVVAADATTKSYVDALFASGSNGSGIEDGDGDTSIEPNNQDELIFTTNTSTVGVLGESGFNLSFGDAEGIFIGDGAGESMTLTGFANYSVGLGENALSSATSGFGNVAIGPYALSNSINTAGTVAVGNSALTNCTGTGNTAVGNVALFSVTTGINNTALGNGAITLSSSVQNSVGIGFESLYSGASFSTGVGSQALSNTSATHCVGIGYKAGIDKDGNHNIAVGSNALGGPQGGGGFNVAIGTEASYENGAGDSNVSIGYQSMKTNDFGDDNVAVGYQALLNTGGGSRHTCVGYKAGLGLTGGESSTAIGYLTNQSLAGGAQVNNTAVGSMATNTAGNQVRLGNSTVSSIGGFANWSNVSDQRFKKNVKEDVAGLNFINELRPVTYNLDLHAIDDWFDDNLGFRDETLDEMGYKKEQIVYSGFLAQEVEATAQNLGYDFSGVDKPKNDTDFYGLRYAEFVVPLVKAVQELDAKNEVLLAENTLLKELLMSYESRLSALESKVNE